MRESLAQFTQSELNTIESNALPGFKFKSATIGEIISSLVPYVFVLGGVLMLFYIALGGYTMMVSRGDPKALQSAQGKITSGLIGFLVLFTAYWIVKIIGQMLGLPQFSTIFGF